MNEIGTTETQSGLLKQTYTSNPVSDALSERLKRRKEKRDEEKASTDSNAPMSE